MNNITHPIKTKIVATLGPATSDLETIKNLVCAGATVFRLNFSHGKHVDHKSRFALVRQIEKELGVHLAILADLQGPKIRIGTFENGEVSLRRNQLFAFVLDKSVGTEDQVWLPHREVFESVMVGDILLIDDGRTRMETVSVSSNKISARVLHDTIISDSKGINFPDTDLKLPALTDKDITDLEFAITLGADWIALSFVQDSNDVISARELIGQKAKIISKIEKPSALKNIDAIIDQSDAIMVARGDLGVECAWHDIPAIQNKLVQTSRAAGKPVVVATQMLESMIHAAVPTRAEVSDVANAVAQGADAVMLSAETATGSFPIEAVTAMADISRSAMGNLSKTIGFTASLDTDDDSMSIASAAGHIAQMRDASCIVTFSETGATALRVSKSRTNVPILAVCQKIKVARMLALVWGVTTKVSKDEAEFERSRNGDISSSLLDAHLVKSKRPIVVTSGSVFGTPGGTDSIKIAYVENIQQ